MDNSTQTVTPTQPTDNNNSGSSVPPQPTTSSSPPTSPPQSSTPPVAPPPSDSVKSQKRKFLLPLIAFLAIFVGFGILAYWYYQTEMKKNPVVAPQPSPAKITTTQTLIVGTDPTYPPMEYLVEGKLMGYDIDLANFIGKELGVQIKFKDMLFDDLFSALEASEVDMVISTVTVTDERKEKYDFSDPYLQAGQVILAQNGNTTIKDTSNLKGKKIGVQKGTTIETEALKYTSDELVIRYPDFVTATAALVKGEVDAIFADLPGAKGLINDNPSLKIASDPFTTEYYAIVFRKNDPKITQINDALASLRAKGILTELRQKWLDK